jgi:hypothetical protein
MEIKIRKLTAFHEVKISDGSTIIDLGLHNVAERRQLAKALTDAAEELLEGLEVGD